MTSLSGLAIDRSDNIYFTASHCAFKVDTKGILSRIAGTSREGFSGDGSSATSAQLFFPGDITPDGAGNVFIADSVNGRIRRVSSIGIIATVAGGGNGFHESDDGVAFGSDIGFPVRIAVDHAGNLFISEYGRVRKVSSKGLITTVAGYSGSNGYSGDGGPAVEAQLNNSAGAITVDQSGNMFIADDLNNRVRKVSPSGIISTVVGDGTPGESGDGGAATDAQIRAPSLLATDRLGNLYVATAFAVRKVSPEGLITTVASSGASRGSLGDGGSAIGAFFLCTGIAVDSMNNLFIADSYNLRIRKVLPDGTIWSVVGNGLGYYSQNAVSDKALTDPPIGSVVSIALDAGRNLIVAGMNKIVKVSADGSVTNVVNPGTFGLPNALSPRVSEPFYARAVRVDAEGNLFIAGNNQIRKISPTGTITAVAGNGIYGFSGDGGLATNAQLDSPTGISIDGRGNLFIADSNNNRIRMVSTSGIITTVAGNGMGECSSDGSDGGLAAYTQLNSPVNLISDHEGNVFIAEPNCRRVRKVSRSGVITTAANNIDVVSLAEDDTGTLFAADGNSSVFRISADGGILKIAGSDTRGYSGDGGPAITARLDGPSDLALDPTGNIYVADSGNGAVRLLQKSNHPVLIGSVLDAASESERPLAPGKIIVIYGAGMGPLNLVLTSQTNKLPRTELAGTTVSINGHFAPILYTSSTQVSVIVPYDASGQVAVLVVSNLGQTSPPMLLPMSQHAPSLFSSDGTGAGQLVATNSDGSLNSAANPARIATIVSFFATGDGWHPPKLIGAPQESNHDRSGLIPIRVLIDGVVATEIYVDAFPNGLQGVTRIMARVPVGVSVGGYVPVTLEVGGTTSSFETWIAVTTQ